MLPRIEYSVVAPASPQDAWNSFTDLQRLLGRSIYADAAWVQGVPWQVSSRARYVIERPVAATLTAVVTLCEPPRRIGMLNHSLGITAQQLVTFRPLADGTTAVTMSVEFVGQSTELPPDAVADAITFLTHDALDTMLASLRAESSPKRRAR